MAANLQPPHIGREKETGSWPHALMVHYCSVMRDSIKREWHCETNSLSLIKSYVFFFKLQSLPKRALKLQAHTFIFLFFVFLLVINLFSEVI